MPHKHVHNITDFPKPLAQAIGKEIARRIARKQPKAKGKPPL
jgi:hypothetical protein